MSIDRSVIRTGFSGFQAFWNPEFRFLISDSREGRLRIY
jgi:hypothetical protein